MKKRLALVLLLCAVFPCYVISDASTATIPAFPEEENVEGCSLRLSDEHYQGIKNACGSSLDRSRCCPVLAAWLYSAYSSTALKHAAAAADADAASSYSYDMPLLPDDSETCVVGLGKALKDRGIQLMQPNDTCDVVYCYCGIRLHPFTCPHQSFHTLQNLNLENHCLTPTAFPPLSSCSNCLHTLYSLKKKASSNSSKASENRTTKIHNKDCELMGLTWLLAKNTTAYIHTVSAVLRALMLNADGSDPQSCTLSSEGKPLAVDSSEMSDTSSSAILQAPTLLSLLLVYLITLLGMQHVIVILLYT
ncbi:hypothetical protein HN51_037898 [Arachis hypogaea]|uniref:Uncharacterized protein n=1 Tax=Arachis hypogaea TaxID=3818 RepID=A0A444ZU08_ARAHY|nr:uncharacterized GPI-anchored protein At4g28100 [Arachis hypogaea]QHO03524.1 putative GPI-anchored protein [Arachis hypogaea]RYR17705.1 hypothetical protein Ahy_B03g062399 [Arachis hypogaea]